MSDDIIRMRVYEDDYGWTSFDEDDVDDPDSFAVDVPVGAWATYQEAVSAAERAHAALCEQLGLAPLGAQAVKPCDEYHGNHENSIGGGWSWWTSCRRCAHPKEAHA